MTNEEKSTTEADSTDALTTAADQQSGRVLMADGGQSDAKVIGHNTDNSGQTVGVWGEVDSTDGCGLATPDDARIDGTLLTNASDFTVQAGTTTTEDAQNVVAGHASNSVTDGTVGATIAGGGYDDGETDKANVIHDDYGTIGGGFGNQAGSNDNDAGSAEYATVGGGSNNTASGLIATVGGGVFNTASDDGATVGGGGLNTARGSSATVGGGFDNTAGDNWATISGGFNNTASGEDATVGGGEVNIASGDYATIPGGERGVAENAYSFVWNDGAGYHPIPDRTSDGLSSDTAVDGEPVTGSNTFSVSAQNGVRFITGDSAVTYISGGSTGWNTTSARTAKTNVDPVDPERALAGVDSMEVATWEYDNDGEAAGTTHIGPMAGDFHDAFDVGDSDEHINSVNARGVLFAAVQGLSTQLDDKDDRIDELESRLDRLEAHLDTDTQPADD